MDEVVLHIYNGDGDASRLDRVTTALYDDLRESGAVRVRRADQDAEAGAKSGVGGSIAELVLTGTLSGGTVTAVYKVIVAWLDRTKARSVTWKDGEKELVLTAVSSKEQRRVFEQLANREPGTTVTRAADGAEQ
jgi:hypothetical protein